MRRDFKPQPVGMARLLVAAAFAAFAVDALTFVSLGGFGSNDVVSRALAAAVTAEFPDIILSVGGTGLACDVNDTCTGAGCGLSVTNCTATLDASIGQYWHSALYPYTGTHGSGSDNATNRFFPTITNERGFASGASAVRDAFSSFFSGLPGNKRYYDFVRGPVHFFALDSTTEYEEDGTSATSAQAAWLRARLAASTAKHRVVYFTAAPYTSASTSAARGAHWMRWPFGAWGATLVLSTSATEVGSPPSGSPALYERLTALDGTLHIVNDLGGAWAPENLTGQPLGFSEFRWSSGYGFLLVTADDNGMKVELKTFKAYAAMLGADFSPRLIATSDTVQVAPYFQQLRVSVIGDFGYAGDDNLAVAATVKADQPDIIVTTGDNNYPDGEAKTIDANIGQYYSGYIYPYHGGYGSNATINRFFPTLGNHDWHAKGAKPYLDYFSGLPGKKRYYDFVRGPVHFFVVDSDPAEPDGTSPTSVQGKWIRARLNASRSPHRVVVFHHPPWSSDITHGDNPWMDWGWDKLGATLVLSGHSHNYERFAKEQMMYIVNGAGGAKNLYSLGEPHPSSVVRFKGYGYLSLAADASAIRAVFTSTANATIDSFEATPFAAPSSNSTKIRIAVLSNAAATIADAASAVKNSVTTDAFDVVVTLGGNSQAGWTSADADAVLGHSLSGFMAPYYGVHGTALTTRYVNAFLPTFGDPSVDTWLNYFPLGFRQGQPNVTAESPSRLYYTARHGPVQFFMLDTTVVGGSGTEVNGTQAMWLRGALAASSAAHRVVCMHTPPTCTLCNEANAELLAWPFRAWGATLLLAGGPSRYERLQLVDGITLIIHGAENGIAAPSSAKSSAALAASPSTALLLLDVSVDSLSVKLLWTGSSNVLDDVTLNSNSAVIDSLTTAKPATASPAPPPNPSAQPSLAPPRVPSAVPGKVAPTRVPPSAAPGTPQPASPTLSPPLLRLLSSHAAGTAPTAAIGVALGLCLLLLGMRGGGGVGA